jgi:hypothetical protein
MQMCVDVAYIAACLARVGAAKAFRGKGLMRWCLYNMRYGTGGGFCWPWQGYLRQTTPNVNEIAGFLKGTESGYCGVG